MGSTRERLAYISRLNTPVESTHFFNLIPLAQNVCIVCVEGGRHAKGK